MRYKLTSVDGLLTFELRDGLAARGFRLFTPPNNGSSIVTFYVDPNHASTREILEKAGVQVSFREKGTQIRVSPALFNTRADVQRFLEVVGS